MLYIAMLLHVRALQRLPETFVPFYFSTAAVVKLARFHFENVVFLLRYNNRCVDENGRNFENVFIRYMYHTRIRTYWNPRESSRYPGLIREHCGGGGDCRGGGRS